MSKFKKLTTSKTVVQDAAPIVSKPAIVKADKTVKPEAPMTNIVKQNFKWNGKNYLIGEEVTGLPDELKIKFCA